MKITKTTVLLIACMLFLEAFQQKAEQEKLPGHQELRQLLDEAIKTGRNNPDTATIMVREVLKIAREQNIPEFEAEAYSTLGWLENRKSDFKHALSYLDRALDIYNATGDSAGVADIHGEIGIVYKTLKQYDKALEYQQKAVTALEKFAPGSTALGNAYNNIGILYDQLEQYEEALEFHRKTLEIRKSTKDTVRMAIAYMNTGLVYKSMENYEKAEENYLKALNWHQSIKRHRSVELCYINLTNLYNDMQQYERGVQTGLKALETNEKSGNRYARLYNLVSLAIAYRNLNQTGQSIALLEEAKILSRELGLQKEESDIFKELALAFEKQGNFENAFENHQTYVAKKDSLFNEESEARILELRTQFETERKEQEIINLEKAQQQRLRERNFLLLGSGTLLLLGLYIFRLYFLRKKAYRELIREKEKSDQLLTDLKNTHEKLTQSEKMASLGQLTAGIAHEINNPVNFVTGNTQALHLDFQELKPILQLIAGTNDQTDPEKLAGQLSEMSRRIETEYLVSEMDQLLDSIKNGGQRIQKIVGSLKAFSHPSRDQFNDEDLHDILETTLTILNSKIKANNIGIRKNLGELPKINCQYSQISQVFMNVLDNAIEAMPDGGQLDIVTTAGSAKVSVSIKDNGIGIEETALNKIFDPFYTTKEVGRGTGLGLSISYSIIQEHKGEIKVSSQTGKGTQVIIELPLTSKP